MKTGKLTLLVVLISLLIGTIAGIAGSFVARIYVIGNDYKVPFFGEINYSGSDLNRPNLVIRDAKKIVIEQEIKIDETITAVDKSIVGIYKKMTNSQGTSTENLLTSYYELDNYLSQGLVVTADGWALFSYPSVNIKTSSTAEYVMITKDKRLFNIDKIQKTADGKYFFAHATGVNDLPVRKFFDKNGLNRGKTILVRGIDDLNLLTSVIGVENPNSLIESSDDSNIKLILADDLGEEMKGDFLFDLSGDIVGLVHDTSNVILIDEFNLLIRNLLETKEIKHATLGIDYVMLNKVLPASGIEEKGALVYSVDKKSSAELAGLKPGDIILHINNIEININNKISDIIAMQTSGDIISISYRRGGEDLRMDVQLQ